jgi:integrase
VSTDQKTPLWTKTPVANLVRYEPSGIYFVRAKVAGKLFRKSLGTDVLSIAKLRLADVLKTERLVSEQRTSVSLGKLTFADAVKVYQERLENDPSIKKTTKKYQQETLDAIARSWPDLAATAINRISKADCLDWLAFYAKHYSPTRVNGAISVLRRVLEIGVEQGLIYDNPAKSIDAFVREVEAGGGSHGRKNANLVRFLAYGGFRFNEAKNITWADCNFDKSEITVRGDPETGTKNWSIRRVPMIDEMRRLLEKLRAAQPTAQPSEPVIDVHDCRKAMTRAAKKVGFPRLTHHDLRHLFATRCIESGVDIPTVSKWLGHKDGGALAMRVYGHLRDIHSADMAKKVRFTADAETSR